MRGGTKLAKKSLKSLRKYTDEADDFSSKVVMEYFEEDILDHLRWCLNYDYKSDAGVGNATKVLNDGEMFTLNCP